MKKARLLGTKLLVSGGRAEHILNLLADTRIPFKEPCAREDGLALYVRGRSAARLRRLARREGLAVKELSVGRITDAARRLGHRKVLLFGLLPCTLLLWVSSLFVWEIDVRGNETVSDGRILRELDELGIKIGVCRVGIDQYRLSNEMLLRIPELSWLTLNTFGSRLEVCVREEVPMPDIVDISEAAELTAAKSGIVDHMTVLAGAAAVKRGELVDEGQTLVSSAAPDILGGVRYEHAAGEVWAWTHYEWSACTPLETFRKDYTGAEYCRRALNFFTKRINLYLSTGNPYAFCDRITMYNNMHLPGGTVLPFGVYRERAYEYKPVLTPLDEDAARRWLENRLHERLQGMIDGEIKSESFLVETKDGVITVTLRAVCLENIARTVPYGAGNTDIQRE